ncbi:MAG: hypothetical protein ACK4K9_03130 [Bacteroidia bacterium]
MYNTLLSAHNSLRWLFLAAALYAIIKSLISFLNKSPFTPAHNKAGSILIALTHTQLLIGLILWFVSPNVQNALADFGASMKDKSLRLALLEHPLTNIIAVAIIQIGRIKAKKAYEDVLKHKRVLIYYGLGLLLILSRIPWANSPIFRFNFL